MRLTPFTTITLILLSVVQQTHAQRYVPGLVDGFMQGQRKAGLSVIGSKATYETYYIGQRETRNPNLGTVTTESITLSGTYGLGYDMDLIVSAPYVRTQASAGYWSKQEGFQDISAALRWEAYDYKLGKTRLSWLFIVGYSIPLQSYVNDALLAIGQGSRNLDGRTMLHYKAGSFFLTGQFGYIRRGQATLDRVVNYYDPSQLNPNTGSLMNVPDVTDAVIRAGIQAKQVYVDGWVQKQTPYNKGTDIAPGIPFPTNAIGFTRAGATLYVPIVKNFGFTAGYSTTLDGQNIGKSSRISGGIILGR